MIQYKHKDFISKQITNICLITGVKSWKPSYRYSLKIVSLAMLLVLGSCAKWLDIKPESEIILDEYWTSGAQATAVVGSCYKALTEDDCMSRIILWGEGRSDNVSILTANGDADYDLRTMVQLDISPSNALCSWGPFYRVINYCNTFLHFAPNVLAVDKNFTTAELESLTSEVLTIRALAYFYLIRTYKNVPWIDKPGIDDAQDYNITQAPESEIIAHIINDLQVALKSAPTDYGPVVAENKGRITKNAVLALLADIYLWNNQYENCVEMCDQIMADKQLKFVDLSNASSTFNSLFSKKNSTESIFELQFGDENGKQPNNMIIQYYGIYGWRGISKLCFSYFLFPPVDKSPFKITKGTAKESDDDMRLKDFILPFNGSFTIFKYTGNYRIESSDGSAFYYYLSGSPNWIVYRLCDVILMKAEALVQLNRSQADLDEALLMVNTTYMRSNPKLLGDSLKKENYLTQDDMNKLVLRERQREFLFEGKRWYDLVRLARRKNTVGALISYVAQKFNESGSQIGSDASLDALFLPVNKDDLKLNPKLVQNPFYEVAGE